MTAQVEQTITGLLRSDAAVVPVEIRGHSRYSLRVTMRDIAVEDWPRDGEASFTLTIGGNEFELGPCRVFRVNGSHPAEGLIVFMDHPIDIEDLLNEKRISVSDEGLFNLHLILTQKEKVHPRFKEYSSNLTFELSVYKQFFDDLDRRYAQEPARVQEHLQEMTTARQGREFFEFYAGKIVELESETAAFSREENEAHGFFFRKHVWDFIMQSRFMTRTNLRPRGYAGDFEMMQMLYENEYSGNSIFARLLHKFPLERPAAQAVRNRKDLIAERIRREVRTRAAGVDKLSVLSVACGPAAELKDIYEEPDAPRVLKFRILDQDTEALGLAMGQVKALERRRGERFDIRPIVESVRSMLRIRNLSTHWGTYDIVYSMGLFDYLTPPVARAVLARLYTLVAPGGRLIIGNFHPSNPDRVFMEYWLDWVLYYRTESEILGLTDGIPCADRRVFFEDMGCQMFLELSAPGGGDSV